MREKRGAHAFTAGPNGLLYAIGGYDVTAAEPTQFMATGEWGAGWLADWWRGVDACCGCLAPVQAVVRSHAAEDANRATINTAGLEHITSHRGPLGLPANHSPLLPHPPTLLPAVEAYEPRMNAWMPRAPMHMGRAYGGAAWAEGSLWVVGGMQSDHYNEAFER